MAAELFDSGFELLARVEGHDTTRRDRDFFARLRIAAKSLRLVAQLKIAEARQLDALAPLEGSADFFEKRLHHVFRFALVEPNLFEQKVGELRLC